MSAEVFQIVKNEAAPAINEEAIELVEGVLERLKTGKSLAIAIVEVYSTNEVGTAYSKSNKYHHLNSGAARLAARLAVD